MDGELFLLSLHLSPFWPLLRMPSLCWCAWSCEHILLSLCLCSSMCTEVPGLAQGICKHPHGMGAFIFPFLLPLLQLNPPTPELPPSCTPTDYHSASCFSLPLCPYHIRLWSPLTHADARYPDGAVNRAQCSKSSLLLPVSPFLAVALTITSPQLSQLTALWVAISCVTPLQFTIGTRWLGARMKAVTSYLPEGLLNKGLIFAAFHLHSPEPWSAAESALSANSSMCFLVLGDWRWWAVGSICGCLLMPQFPSLCNRAWEAATFSLPHPGRSLYISISLCSLNVKGGLNKSSLKPRMDKYLKVINTQLSNYLEWSRRCNDG